MRFGFGGALLLGVFFSRIRAIKFSVLSRLVVPYLAKRQSTFCVGVAVSTSAVARSSYRPMSRARDDANSRDFQHSAVAARFSLSCSTCASSSITTVASLS